MINFPSNPSLNQQYEFEGKVWKWNGTAWSLVSSGGIGSSYSLINGSAQLTLNADGTVTFPDDTVQTTAYTGGVGGEYTLPTATHTTLGGVKIDGTTITISGGVISATIPSLSDYQTTAGLSANVAKLSANNAAYLGGIAANQYAFVNAVSTVANLNDLLDVDINAVTDGQVLKYNSTYGHWENAPDSTSNGGAPGISLEDLAVSINDTPTGNGTLTYNNTTGVFVYTPANFSVYQTAAGLSANVAKLSANNSSYLGTVAAAGYVQNTDSRTLSGNLNFTGANLTIATDLTITGTAYNKGLLITGDRGNIYVGNNTRDARTMLSLNSLTGYFSGVQVTRAGSELWFAGASNTENYVIRRSGTTDDISINSTGVVTIANLTATSTINGTSNNTLYLGGVAANQYAYANLTISQLTGASGNVALYANGSMSFPLNRIETGNNSIALWSSNQATVVWRGDGGAGLPLQTVIQSMPGYVNLGTATGILGGATVTYNWRFDTSGVMTFPDSTTQNTAWTGSVSNLTANNTSYVGSISAANVVSNSQLSSNLANYQTTAGLSANVATLAANNASYLGTIAAAQYAYANGSNFSINNPLTVTYTPATTTGFAITATGKDTQGGTGYFDFFKATNTTSGVTNGSKTFRLTNTGSFEIINSAYNGNLFTLSNAGALNVPGPITIGGKQAVNGPAFSAYAEATLQTIPNGSLTKVLFQTEEFDTNSNYANSTFTPTVEGYYQLNAEVRLDGASGTGEMMIMLYKNGTGYKRGTNQQGTQIAANFWAMQVSTVVYANGTGDYFEIYVQQGSGGSVSVTAVNNSAITWFNGCMLRGA